MNVYKLWPGEDEGFALKFQNMPETMQAGSNDDFIFGRYPVGILAGTSTILTDISCGFPQLLQEKLGTVP